VFILTASINFSSFLNFTEEIANYKQIMHVMCSNVKFIIFLLKNCEAKQSLDDRFLSSLHELKVE